MKTLTISISLLVSILKAQTRQEKYNLNVMPVTQTLGQEVTEKNKIRVDSLRYYNVFIEQRLFFLDTCRNFPVILPEQNKNNKTYEP